MKFFTFCVDIKRHSQETLTQVLQIMIKSLDHYVKQYQLIVYTNFIVDFCATSVTYRDYYDKTVDKMYDDQWLNLSYNKINVYKDLYDEFDENFIWIDLDTIITNNISYMDSLSHVFVENGGCSLNRNTLFTNNSTYYVPRKNYIQGNFWKLNIELYGQLMNILDVIKQQKLILRYDLQDLFNYYVYVHRKGNLNGINILGNTCCPHTLNGLAQWDSTGITHATMSGLQHLYYDEGQLKSKFYSEKEIHILSFTFNTIKELYHTDEFKKIFPYLLTRKKKIGVFGTCRIDDYKFGNFKQISTQYPYVYQNDQFIINVRPLGYTTTSSDVLQNLSLIKTGLYTDIHDAFIYKNVFLKHGGKMVIYDLDYDFLVIELCSTKKIIHKKSGFIFPYEIEGSYQMTDYDFISETLEETIDNVRKIKTMINCPIILLPPITFFEGSVIKGEHENVNVSHILAYRNEIIHRINECVKQFNDVIFYDWNVAIKEHGIPKMLTDQFHFTEFGKKHVSSKILNLIQSPISAGCHYQIEDAMITIPQNNHILHRYYQMFPTRGSCEPLFRMFIKYLMNDQIIDIHRNIVDLGAWIGDNSLPWSMRIKGTVYAIDPSTENISYIRTLSELNNVKNIKVIEAAISNTIGVIYTNNDLKHAEFNEHSGKYKIMSTTLDQLFINNIINDITFIHLTVEGFELKVLNGATKLIATYKPIISWKAHLDMNIYRQILKFMRELDYMSFLVNEKFPQCRSTCRNFISFHNNTLTGPKIIEINHIFGQSYRDHWADNQKTFLLPQ